MFTFYLFIFFPPRFQTDGPIITERPGNIEADIGSNVTLKCGVSGNPTPEVTWMFEDSRRVLSTGPAYTFWMSSDMAGKYTCRAKVPGFKEASADSYVLLKGKSFAFIWKHLDGMMGAALLYE